MFSIRQTKDFALIRKLDLECFPGDEPYEPEGATWWVARDARGEIVGFAGAKPCKRDPGVFLCRAGVLPAARGKGLQKRFIRTRIAWAKRRRAKFICTYTSLDNQPSSNSLIRRGFKLYEPADRWAGDEFLYWILDL